MKKCERLIEFSLSAGQAADQNALWESLKDTLSSFGVEWVNYAFGPVEDLIFLSNMSEEWLAFYSEHYSQTDYLVHHCNTVNQPLALDISHFNGELGLDKINANMMHEMKDMGARGGITVPLQKTNSDFICGSGVFFGLSERETKHVMEMHGDEIALIMHSFHQHVTRHQLQAGGDTFSIQHSKAFKKADLLTQREIDVLRYLAAGLRPDRIAGKMDLQVPTINLHIQKAMRRLGAKTREQAIVVAMNKRQLIL